MTRTRVGVVLVGLGLLGPGAAFVAARLFGEDVTVLARANDEAERAEARRLRDPRDDVAEIYGVAEPGAPVRVVFPEPARRIVPAEDPARVLYVVDRTKGESPFLARTLVAFAAAGGLLLLVVGAVVLALSRRKA